MTDFKTGSIKIQNETGGAKRNIALKYAEGALMDSGKYLAVHDNSSAV